MIGIMGKTQGVKMEASPKPKATSRKAPRPWSCGGWGGAMRRAAAGGFGFGVAGGNAGAVAGGGRVHGQGRRAVHFGRHAQLWLQVW